MSDMVETRTGVVYCNHDGVELAGDLFLPAGNGPHPGDCRRARRRLAASARGNRCITGGIISLRAASPISRQLSARGKRQEDLSAGGA